MDNLKIGILVLGPCVVVALLGGCAPKVVDAVPPRAAVAPALVSGSNGGFDARNDARLGTPRDPIVRDYGLSVTATYDRQQIINGRPYVDFDTITRSRDRFER
ncbi:MAG: hypothetical protein LW806_08940 [Planctomycetaceae bacterium]|nr:hypothetical protein [Planctomycetaceae bacterium]